MAARRDGNIESVRFLVNKGADVYAKDNEGNTPLEVARQLESDYRNHAVVVRYLESVLDIPTSTGQPASVMTLQSTPPTMGEASIPIELKGQGHERGSLSAVFSPDGKKIVTASSRANTARIWDAESNGLQDIPGISYGVLYPDLTGNSGRASPKVRPLPVSQLF